jgi:hypothetical protein
VADDCAEVLAFEEGWAAAEFSAEHAVAPSRQSVLRSVVKTVR